MVIPSYLTFDDGSGPPINFTVPVPLFGTDETSMYVSKVKYACCAGSIYAHTVKRIKIPTIMLHTGQPTTVISHWI